MPFEVEMLWWRGCPSWERALELLRAEMEAAGLDPEAVVVTEIEDEEEAARRDFPGSPTILINGRDLQPPAAGEPRGLTCRVYRRPDGCVSPLPDPALIRSALESARRFPPDGWKTSVAARHGEMKQGG